MASVLPSLTRVLGGTEENWTKSTAGGTGIVAFGALFNRAIDVQNVCSATQQLLDCHPLMRSQIVENGKSKLCLQACDSEQAVNHVEEKEWPPVLGGDHSGIIIFPGDHSDKHGSLALDKIINDELNVNFLNPGDKTSPSVNIFRVTVYPNQSRNQTIILLKFHSGVLDRQSCNVLIQEFISSLSGVLEGNTVERLNVENALPVPLEDLIPKGKFSKGFFQKGFDAVGYAVNAKKYSLLPFQPSFVSSEKATFESRVVSLSIGKTATTSLIQSCKKENVTIPAALSAAFLKTVASLKELKEKKLDEFSYTCVINCRSMLEPKLPESVLGNYSLGIPQNEKVKDGVEFWDLARQVSSSIEKDVTKGKQFSELPVLGMLFSQVMKRPSLTPNSSMRTALFTLFVDPPMEAQWKGADGLGLVGTVGPFSSMHFVGPCFCLGEAVIGGPELVLSFIYPIPHYTRAQILGILQSAVNLLTESCHHH